MSRYRQGLDAALGALDGIPTRYDPARGFTRSEGPLAAPGSAPVGLPGITTVPQAVDYARGGWGSVTALAAADPGKRAAYQVAADRFRWVADLGRWASDGRGIAAAEHRPLVANLKGALRAANDAARSAREGRAVPSASGEQEFKFADLAKQVNKDHDRLAALWPQMRAGAPALTTDDKVAWNALVYVQQGIELQLAAALAKASGGAYRQDPARLLGVFAGLPGGGGRHDPKDPRFAVPRLRIFNGLEEVSDISVFDRLRAAVGEPALATLIIGAVVVTLVAAAAVIVLGMVVKAIWTADTTARVDMARDNLAARTAAYNKAAEEAAKKGLPPPDPNVYFPPPPPPPPPSSGFGFGLALALGAGALAAAVIVPALAPKRAA